MERLHSVSFQNLRKLTIIFNVLTDGERATVWRGDCYSTFYAETALKELSRHNREQLRIYLYFNTNSLVHDERFQLDKGGRWVLLRRWPLRELILVTTTCEGTATSEEDAMLRG